MEVSVIIPVFNAEKFIERAVNSALKQPETSEVLLIDDGSTDGSIEICQQFASEYEKVIFFQHPDKCNHGSAVTRNVGIEYANHEFIAFLDADDYYAENRFAATEKVFRNNDKVDAVFEQVLRYKRSHSGDGSVKKTHIYKMSNRFQANHLFEVIVTSDMPVIHLNGLTIKKEALSKIGLFDAKLKQVEDTDFFWLISDKLCLQKGEQNKIVAFSEIHADNKTHRLSEVLNMRYLLYKKWFLRIHLNNWSVLVNRIFTNNYMYYHPLMKPFQNIGLMRVALKIIMLSFWILRQPKLLFKLL